MSGQFRSKESTARYLASWSKLRRNVAGRVQTLYAAVLDDGNIVRPVPVSRYTYPVRRSREKSEAAEEKTKRKPRVRVLREAASGRAMGGAESKENQWAVYLN